MDLLEQLKQQNPEAFREQKSAPMADAYGREYSWLVALVIRISGGRIKDAKQASVVLLVISIVIISLSLIIFFTSGSDKQSFPQW
jgi:hypothetical protein